METPFLAKTVQTTFAQKPKLGDIGMELEMEFPKTANAGHFGNVTMPNASYAWIVHADNSLRNGVEYVLSSPIHINDVPMASQALVAAFAGVHIRWSPRTSLHVHVNAQGFTWEKVINAVAAFTLLDAFMISTQGPSRKGNLFCLSSDDAEDWLESFCNEVGNELQGGNIDEVHSIFSDEMRYAALNLAAMRKFGSFEFRFLRGTLVPQELSMWPRILYNLVHNGAKYSPKEHLEMAQGNKKVYLQTILGSIETDFLMSQAPENALNTIDAKIGALLRVLVMRERMSSDRKKFVKPRIYFEEDTDEIVGSPAINNVENEE